VFCDSLEVFGSDWTDSLLKAFRERRGYELRPHLPALVADVTPNAAAIRHDWGKTLTELVEEQFLAPMQNWARSQKTLFRIQGYGIPPAVISSNMYADLPEGEGSQWKVVRASRWSSSASHLYSRPVTSSETWTWLHSPVFRATPLDMKAEADIHFLQGINHLIGHGWPYTAEGIEYPGWRFYAAAVFNDKNPWWIAMPDITRYLQRVSFLMRQGKPANDVALYLPNSDAWSSFTAGHVHMIEILREHIGTELMPQILDYGYGLDFFDDRSFDQLGKIENGTLSMGDGRYRVIVLPAVERIPLATMRKLERFVRAGGILLATRRTPSTAPGLKATAAEHGEIQAISRRLFDGPSAKAKLLTKDAQLGEALRTALTPDVAFSRVIPGIGFVHRTTPEDEIYFVANTANTRQRTKACFRVTGMEAEIWDAMTGKIAGARVTDRGDRTLTIPLDMEPYGSRILVISRGSRKPAPSPMVAGTAIDLSKGWSVRFGDSAKAVEWENLQSWTDDERTRFYSGTVEYEKRFDVPAGMLRQGTEVRLDFGPGKAVPEPAVAPKGGGPGMRAWYEGPVREAAVVYINGERAGSVWCPPYTLDVTRYLKPGVNELRVVVGNLALNHMAGRPLPSYEALKGKYGVRFEPQDMHKVEPIPAGLTGPVRLVPFGPAE
jgi:hypothetical protein